MVVRREADAIRRYVHLSTGNYNAVTAHLYTDIGLFTANEQIAADATDLFNYLTGYSAKTRFPETAGCPDHHARRVRGHDPARDPASAQ